MMTGAVSPTTTPIQTHPTDHPETEPEARPQNTSTSRARKGTASVRGRNVSTPSRLRRHIWSNRAPLYKAAPRYHPYKLPAEKLTVHLDDITPLKKQPKRIRDRLKAQISEYIKLSPAGREKWLNNRMATRKSNGKPFEALKGQNEVIATRRIRAFELLGHYAGEVNDMDSLTDAIEKYGLEEVGDYCLALNRELSISAFRSGNICSLINSNSASAGRRELPGPDEITVPANVAPMSASSNGQRYSFVVSLCDIAKLQPLWFYYGTSYWCKKQKNQLQQASTSLMAPTVPTISEPSISGSEENSSIDEAMLSTTGSEFSFSVPDAPRSRTSRDSSPQTVPAMATDQLTNEEIRPTPEHDESLHYVPEHSEPEHCEPEHSESDMLEIPQIPDTPAQPSLNEMLISLVKQLRFANIDEVPEAKLRFVLKSLESAFPGCQYKRLSERTQSEQILWVRHNCKSMIMHAYMRSPIANFNDIHYCLAFSAYFSEKFTAAEMIGKPLSEVESTIKSFTGLESLNLEKIKGMLTYCHSPVAVEIYAGDGEEKSCQNCNSTLSKA